MNESAPEKKPCLINADNCTDRVLIAQTVISIAFFLSELAGALTERMLFSAQRPVH